MNRLSTAASAYLKSAAHQPIHWFPWGPDAFAAALDGDRPVLLDIGAVWCHWCHVMDGESYEDPALAAFLNENFVCIKVDRDERPDVDVRYQRAVQAMTGQGGWPLTAFLTPAGEAFYGGTYFPPDGMYGRPGYRAVLEQVLQLWRGQRDRIDAQVTALQRALQPALDEAEPGALSPTLLSNAADAMARLFDARHGGFGNQPKFPHPGALRFLLARWHDTGLEGARQIVVRTLDGMADGGFHDQLGGGFHRYSVDARWCVPHFEKMAYDNAELLRAYLDAWSATGNDRYADVARGIVRWIREALADPDGGYGASQDADVGLHDDGDYFTWTLDEAQAELTGDELSVAAMYWDIGTAGEMHHHPGKNVLFVSSPLETVARQLGRTVEEATRLLDSARAKLIAARGRRTAPFVDRTRYASWNAMLAGALLQAGPALGDEWATAHALLTLERLSHEQAEPDAIAHTAGGVSGLLEDQVMVAAAAIDAAEATGQPRWFQWAEAIMDRVWQDYTDARNGGLFDRVRELGGEGLLPLPAKPVQDAPTPSGNGVAALSIARLAAHTGHQRWLTRRNELLAATAGRADELSLHGATLLLAADWALNPAAHLVVADGRAGGQGGSEIADTMHQRALATYLPRRVVQRVRAGSDASLLPPAAQGMMASTGEGPRAFACVGATCSLPSASVEEWRKMLTDLRRPTPVSA
ncbi:MAG TPA: thioredoxin domain-containing protein [Gemmatimonadales bacterium]|nr:thioredoxin domain-containing protein [Gemmatimonadales bacterium]